MSSHGFSTGMSASVQISKTELDWLVDMSHGRFSFLILLENQIGDTCTVHALHGQVLSYQFRKGRFCNVGSLKGRFHGKCFGDGFAGRLKHLNHWTVCKQRRLLMPRCTGCVDSDVVPDNAFLVMLAHGLRNQPIFIPILRYPSV